MTKFDWHARTVSFIFSPPFQARMKRAPDIVDKILASDVEQLRNSIEELQAKIEERKDIAKDILRTLNDDIVELTYKEERLGIYGPGYRSSIDKMKSDFRGQIGILKKEAANQEVAYWRDATALEKELRILLSAYEKAKRKKELLDE